MLLRNLWYWLARTTAGDSSESMFSREEFDMSIVDCGNR